MIACYFIRLDEQFISGTVGIFFRQKWQPPLEKIDWPIYLCWYERVCGIDIRTERDTVDEHQ